MMKEKTHENEWISYLNDDLQKVEEMHEIEVPQHAQLMSTLHEFKLERQKAFRREFIAFILTALIILVSYGTIAFKMTTVFIWIQGLALIIIPISFIAEKKRRSKQNEVTIF
jgi:Family of unknown function (DUF5345)